MKRKIFKIAVVAVLLLSPLWLAKNANAQIASSVHIEKSQAVNGNLYTSGQNVVIDGSVSGDLMVVAQSLTVNGSVGGDIIAAASSITINGPVDGNVRVIGGQVNLNNSIARNLNVLADDIIIGPQAHIGWDAYLKSNSLSEQGLIDGTLTAWASNVSLNGPIGHDVKLTLADDKGPTSLDVGPKASLNGSLTYNSQESANISSQAIIKGHIQQNSATQISRFNFIWLWKKILSIFSALMVGLVLIYSFKNTTKGIIDRMSSSSVKTFWSGLLVSLLSPILALILAFTLIGLPLSLIVMAIWLTAIFLAKILTAIWLGRLIINSLKKKSDPSLLWPMVLGVVLSWLIFSLPWAGWIISLLAVWFGLGNIWQYVRSKSSSF